MIAAYRSLVRWLERRTAAELQASNAARGLAQGIVAGAALFALVYAILWGCGALTFAGYGGLSGLGSALAVAIASAVGEGAPPDVEGTRVACARREEQA